MTQPRRQLVDPTQTQFFHLINRCVRRSWLCGRDAYSHKDFEHRKAWLKKRILDLTHRFAIKNLRRARTQRLRRLNNEFNPHPEILDFSQKTPRHAQA